MRAWSSAAGVVKALSDSDWLTANVSSVSSVSGSSWFTTHLAFSSEFHNAFLSQPVATSTAQAIRAATMASFFGASLECPNCWEANVRAMFNSTATADLQATPANRAGNRDLRLLLCTNLMPSGLFSDGSNYSLQVGGIDVDDLELPVYWEAPGEAAARWVLPAAAGHMTITAGSRTAPVALPTPTVAAIAAMSSALNGISSSPVLKSATIHANGAGSHFCQSERGYFPCAGPHLPETAVCSDADEQDDNRCTFPAARMMDGAFSDNLGLALHIGHLQRQFPGQTIRLLTVSNSGCNRSSDPECISANSATSIRSMFAKAPHTDVAPAYLPYIVPAVNRQIFVEELSDSQVVGTRVGTAGITFMTGSFTTVRNRLFGVEGGTRVQLISFDTNSATQLIPGLTNFSHFSEDTERLSQLSSDMYDAMSEVGQRLSTDGCVSSVGGCAKKGPT